MNSMPKDKELEWHYRNAHENVPKRSELRSSIKARRERMKEAKQRITICIDSDVLQGFKTLVEDGRGYQSLINSALREWLAAQSIKDLIKNELRLMLREKVVAKNVPRRKKAA